MKKYETMTMKEFVDNYKMLQSILEDSFNSFLNDNNEGKFKAKMMLVFNSLPNWTIEPKEEEGEWDAPLSEFNVVNADNDFCFNSHLEDVEEMISNFDRKEWEKACRLTLKGSNSFLYQFIPEQIINNNY